MKPFHTAFLLGILGWVLLAFPGEAMAFRTVIIDPGHGGRDLGASDSFVYEKHINLDVARRLERSLQEAGFRTVMTRTSDVFIPLSQRSAIANRHRNAIFVSVHFNSSWKNTVSGIETYYRSSGSEALARVVQRHMIRNMGTTDRGVKTANFAVLRETRHPSILVEGGFISNQTERGAMMEPLYRQVVADSIAQAIVEYARGGRR